MFLSGYELKYIVSVFVVNGNFKGWTGIDWRTSFKTMHIHTAGFWITGSFVFLAGCMKFKMASVGHTRALLVYCLLIHHQSLSGNILIRVKDILFTKRENLWMCSACSGVLLIDTVCIMYCVCYALCGLLNYRHTVYTVSNRRVEMFKKPAVCKWTLVTAGSEIE